MYDGATWQQLILQTLCQIEKLEKLKHLELLSQSIADDFTNLSKRGKEMRQTNSKSIGQYVDCRCKSPLGQKNAAALFSRSLLVWVEAVFSSSVIHYFMHLKLLSWSDKKKCWYYLNANSFLVQVPPIGGCSSSASHPSAVVLLWPRGRFSTWDDSSRPRSWLSKYCWGAESLGTYTRPPQRAFCCIRLHASHFARCIFEGFVWR